MATQQQTIERELLAFLKELTVILQKKLTSKKAPVKPKKISAAKLSTQKKTVRTKSTHKTISAHKKAAPKKSKKIARHSFKYSAAPQELTGISSQNRGETQHSESPQARLYGHIPLSSPAPNISGSNALSSMTAQEKKRAQEKATKAPQFSNNEKRINYALLQSLLRKADTALNFGDNLDAMSDKHGRREKNKKKNS
jgi:hypothetical protein